MAKKFSGLFRMLRNGSFFTCAKRVALRKKHGGNESDELAAPPARFRSAFAQQRLLHTTFEVVHVTRKSLNYNPNYFAKHLRAGVRRIRCNVRHCAMIALMIGVAVRRKTFCDAFVVVDVTYSYQVSRIILKRDTFKLSKSPISFPTLILNLPPTIKTTNCPIRHRTAK